MEFLFEKLQQTAKPIVLYGMGNGADKIFARLQQQGQAPSGVFASSGFVRSKLFHGLPLTSYEAAKAHFAPMVVLLCFGSNRPEVWQSIERIARENEFYVPDVPVCGNTFFTRSFYEQHLKELQQIESLLADAASVRCFREILAFKADGNRSHLLRCETPPQEAVHSILRYTENETYLDLGAFNGDTVLQFAGDVCQRYQHIYAVEPFLKSYQKLLQNTGGLQNVTCIHAAGAQSNAPLLFETKGGRGGSAGSGKGTVVNAFCVDSYFAHSGPTTIKIDVEGMEAEVIAGAAQTIRRFKPKLQIAAYHRTEDLFAIPQQVLALRPDYKLYLRHFPCYPAWDTNFYFV